MSVWMIGTGNISVKPQVDESLIMEYLQFSKECFPEEYGEEKFSNTWFFDEENKLFYSIYDNGAKAAMGNFAAYKSVAGLGSINEVFFDPINSLVSGKLTKEKWTEDIKKANVIMRENLIKE